FQILLQAERVRQPSATACMWFRLLCRFAMQHSLMFWEATAAAFSLVRIVIQQAVIIPGVLATERIPPMLIRCMSLRMAEHSMFVLPFLIPPRPVFVPIRSATVFT